MMAEEKLAIVLETEGDGLADHTIADCDYTVKNSDDTWCGFTERGGCKCGGILAAWDEVRTVTN